MVNPTAHEPEPRKSWWARNATGIRETGLGALSFGCVIAALGLGGDMTLTIIVLLVGWVLGTIALVTAPHLSTTWKVITTILLFLFFTGETGFLYWHFHGLPNWGWIERWSHKAPDDASLPPRPPDALQSTSPPPKQEAQSKPLPAATPSPPWVTKEEIEAQRKLGHELLNYSPEELVTLEASDENIQIFLTKWVKLDYPIAIVPFPLTVQKKEYYVVEMLVSAHNFFSVGGVAAYFDPQKWGDRLRTLHKGDHLIAFCQVQRIERGTPFNSYGMRHDTMHAYNCELP
jgi:hypothetical protein